MPDDESKDESKAKATEAAPTHPDEESAAAEAPEAPEPEAAEGDAAPAADNFLPGAILARTSSLAGETDLDRTAREEEQKLYERRKGKKGKRGLEAAASKRLSKIGEVKVKRPTPGMEGMTGDPLFDRSSRITKWIKDHGQAVGGIAAVAVLGLIGFIGWTYWQDKHQAEASAILGQAYADEHGMVSDKVKDEDDETTATSQPLYPTYKTTAERRTAAIEKYRQVESSFAGSGAATLARLAEAGLLLDSGDAKAAKDAYSDVKASPLAQADAEVRGRAVEGLGFAAELLAQTDTAARASHLDAALSAFKDLEKVEMKGFKELGEYDQARVLEAKGDKTGAIDMLKTARKSILEAGESHPFSYLTGVVDDRLRALDPTAVPKPQAPANGGGGMGNIDMNDPKIQEMIRQIQQQQQQGGGGGGAPPIAPK